MMWYDDPVMVVLIVFLAAGFGYLGYRLAKMILDMF